MRKTLKQSLTYLLSGAMALSAIGLVPYTNLKVNAAEKIEVKGCNMELRIGDKTVCDTSVKGDFRIGFDTFKNKEYAIIDEETDYEIWGYLNNENFVEALAIQPTCYTEITLPGVYVKGAGDLSINANTKDDGTGKNFDQRHIKLTLDPFGSDTSWEGYSVVTDFFGDEDTPMGRPSDKLHLSIEDGLIVTNERTGVTTSSTVQINGYIETTSFCTSDITDISFGSEAKPLDHAFDFTYKDNQKREGDDDKYYELEFNGPTVNAYIDNCFINGGTYYEGFDEKENAFKSLWVYNEAELNIIDTTPADSVNAIGKVDSMRVMTGGKINVSGKTEGMKLPKAKSSYFTVKGTYENIGKQDGRITDYVKTVDCVLDKDAKGYNEATNPTPNADSEGRYSYKTTANNIYLESTSNSLEIIGIAQGIKNGHFEIEAGSGLMNDKGDFWAERGTEVKFTLVPDAGYQYKKGSFKANGAPINDNVLFKATETPGVYVYTMGKNACYIDCEFEDAKDDIAVKAEDIAAANIDMAGNEFPGTMEFSVNDTTVNNADISKKIDTLAGDKELGAVLDLKLTQKIDTVTGEKSWETPISELKEDMKVSLKLDNEAADNTDYSVIRVHGSSVEVLPAASVKYNAETDTIEFSTDRYSTYAIAYKKAAKPVVKPAASLKLSKTKATLYTGAYKNTLIVKATVKGESQKVTWKSSDKKVVTVKNGKLVAVSKGKATITAKANGITKKVTVTVKNPTITVKKGKKAVTKLSLKKGKSVTLTVATNPTKAGSKLASLTKKQKKIVKATYKKNKLVVKGLKKGTVTLSIKSGKATKKIKVTVK